MRKFNFGDNVICIKYDVSPVMYFTSKGMTMKNQLNTHWFNREAIISKTYKEAMDEHYGCSDTEDKDEYEIKFLDDGHTLAWVDGDDLVGVYLN